MNLTLSVDDEVLRKARHGPNNWGLASTSLVRDYLEQAAGKPDPLRGADEFKRLSHLSQGHSRGWKFDREEAHKRP